MDNDIISKYILWCKESHCYNCMNDNPIWDSYKCLNCYYSEQEKVK